MRDPKTPYWVLLLWSALTGIAGRELRHFDGDGHTLVSQASCRASALGINGLGNFGVTVAQFTIPLVIGFSLDRYGWGYTRRSRAISSRERRLCLDALHPDLYRRDLVWNQGLPGSAEDVCFPAGGGQTAAHLGAFVLYFLTFGCFVAMGASLPLIIKEVFAAAPGGAPKSVAFRTVGGGDRHRHATGRRLAGG